MNEMTKSEAVRTMNRFGVSTTSHSVSRIIREADEGREVNPVILRAAGVLAFYSATRTAEQRAQVAR